VNCSTFMTGKYYIYEFRKFHIMYIAEKLIKA